MKQVELILVIYPDAQRATQMLAVLHQLESDGVLKVFDMAAISRSANGQTTVSDEYDLDAGRGSLFGAIVGGLVGLLGGPAGVVVGAITGAAAGGMVAQTTDLGFEQDFLEQIKANLKPNTSALLFILEAQWANRAVEAVTDEGARVLRNMLKDELVKRLV